MKRLSTALRVLAATALGASACGEPLRAVEGPPVEAPPVGAPRAAVTPGPAATPIQRRRGLRLGATCRGGDPCVWSGGDLFITLRVGNGADVPVELPIAFIQRTGPSIALIDPRTGAELQLRTNPGPEELLLQRTVVQPGQAEAIEWVIHESELVHHGTPVGLTARITLFGVMRVGQEEIPFEATTTLPIRGAPGRR